MTPVAQHSTTRRLFAAALGLQGAAAAAWGLWWTGQALFGAPPALGRTGDVIGPPDDVLQMAGSVLRCGAGAVLLLVAAVNVAGAAALGRRVRPVAAAWACGVDAAAWALVAGAWLLRAGGVQQDLVASLAVAAGAAVVAALHALAVRGFAAPEPTAA